MEEDKKEESVEQITKILEQHLENSETMFEKFGTLAFEYADIKRISKILIRYKELKEIEQIHRQENGELRERVKELEEENQQLEAIKDEAIRRYNLESIPTSLVKENEELKQDRNNNYQMIELAQNEMLGYIQGYEDGKKLKRSATACVVENQQYYIIKKQIEKYKTDIEQLRKKLGQKDKIIDLMVNHIATSDSDLCEYLDITTKCKYYAGDNGKTCDNCIKQYFINKAKEI